MDTIDTGSIWEYGSNYFEGGLLSFAISSLLLIFAAVIFEKIISSVIRKLGYDKLSFRYSRRIIKVMISFLVIMMILRSITPLKGIVTTVMSATGILTIIGGLAAQESFGNFIAGFFLSLYHPFNVGDIVSLPEKGITGTVTEMTFRHTVLRTIESSKVIIPNSVMNTAVLEDKEYGQDVNCRMLSMSVAYGTDLPLMKTLITRAVEETPGTIDVRSEAEIREGAPRVMIRTDGFLDSGLNITFQVFTRTFGESFAVCGNVRERILALFAENGVEIPYTKIEIVGKDE